MNGRRILFAAIVTAVIGGVASFLLAELRPQLYPNRIVHSMYPREVVIGSVIGLLIGAAPAAVQELKQQQEREEKLRNYLHTYLSLQDIAQKLEE